jgi:hypothetical protein
MRFFTSLLLICDYEQAAFTVELFDPAAMQFEAFFIELLTAPPSVTAAMAMVPPIMARMSAYSAAEAPDSSRIRLINVFMSNFPSYNSRCPEDMRVALQVGGRAEQSAQAV